MSKDEDFSYDDAFSLSSKDSTPRQVVAKEDPDQRHPTKKRSCSYFLNRIAFCVIAQVALWTTSLRNSTMIASKYISAPTFHAVYGSCDLAHQTILQEKSRYDYCVQIQLSKCNLEFEAALTAENKRVASSVLNNNGLISQLQSQLNNCSTTILQTNLLLQSWTSGQYGHSIPFRETCSIELRKQVQMFVGEDHTSSAQATRSASTYTGRFDSRIVTMATYVRDLSRYNRDYIRNKTENLQIHAFDSVDITIAAEFPTINITIDAIEALTQDIIACMSLDPARADLCQYSSSLYDAYIVSQRRLDNKIDQLYAAINLYQQFAYNYVNDVQLAILRANLFYQSVFGGKGLIQWLLNSAKIIYTLADMCGNSEPNICNFSPSDWAVLTPNWPTIPQVTLPDVADVFQEMQGYIKTIPPRIATISGHLDQDFQQLQTNLHLSLQDVQWTPDDYRPPSYPYKNDTDSEVAAQQEDSQQYLSALKNILYNDSSSSSSSSSMRSKLLRNIDNGNNNINSDAINNILSLNSTWLRSTTQTATSWVDKNTQTWSLGNFDYVWILQSFFTLQGILFFFDYLYRGIQSVKLLIRFWSRSIIQLPTMKAIQREEQAMFSSLSASVQCFGLFLRLLPLIWVQALMLCAMLVVSLYILSALVVPEYYSFCRACVHHTHNETFLSRIGQTTAFNLAASNGNLHAQKGIATYNTRLVAHCDKHTALTQPTYAQSLQTLQTLNDSYASYVAQAEVLQRCVEVSVLDTQVQRQCCVNSNGDTNDNTNDDDMAGATTLKCEAYNTSSSATCPPYIQTLGSQHSPFIQHLWYPITQSKNSALFHHHSVDNKHVLGDNNPSFCDANYLLYNRVESNSNNSSDDTTMNNVFSSATSAIRDSSGIQWKNKLVHSTTINHNQPEFALLQQTEVGMFQCVRLPSCRLTCEGPLLSLLARRSKDCVCHLEWFWNAHLLQGSLVLIIFALMNISRDMVCSGLLRVWWSHFLPPIMPVLIQLPLQHKVKNKNQTKRKDKILKNRTSNHEENSECEDNHNNQNDQNEAAEEIVHNTDDCDDNYDIECGLNNNNNSCSDHDTCSSSAHSVCNDNVDDELEVEHENREEKLEKEKNKQSKISSLRIYTNALSTSFRNTMRVRLQTRNTSKKGTKQKHYSYLLKTTYFYKNMYRPSRSHQKSSNLNNTNEDAEKTIFDDPAEMQHLQARMQWQLTWFVAAGYLKIVVGLSLNYLWYVVANYMQRNIAYDGQPYPTPV